MGRYAIVGNSGSGKSTLAKRLAHADRVAHLDLDTLAWEPSSPPRRRALAESAHAIERFIAAHDSDGWVIEGWGQDRADAARRDRSLRSGARASWFIRNGETLVGFAVKEGAPCAKFTGFSSAHW